MLQPSHHRRVPRVDVDRLMDTAITGGLALLIGLGFATSYTTLRELALTDAGYPPWLAPAVPLSLDLGIIVLSLKVIRAARDGRTALTLRGVVAALSLATVAINTSAADTVTAGLLHAAPPAMFVICFESVVVGLRRNALRDAGRLPTDLPKLGWARWLLDFHDTWTTWRQLVLDGPASATGAQDAPDSATVSVPTAAVMPAPQEDPGALADRDQLVRQIVTQTPHISAPRLAEALAAHGVVVSPRTAQRLKAGASGTS